MRVVRLASRSSLPMQSVVRPFFRYLALGRCCVPRSPRTDRRDRTTTTIKTTSKPPFKRIKQKNWKIFQIPHIRHFFLFRIVFNSDTAIMKVFKSFLNELEIFASIRFRHAVNSAKAASSSSPISFEYATASAARMVANRRSIRTSQ